MLSIILANIFNSGRSVKIFFASSKYSSTEKELSVTPNFGSVPFLSANANATSKPESIFPFKLYSKLPYHNSIFQSNSG